MQILVLMQARPMGNGMDHFRHSGFSFVFFLSFFSFWGTEDQVPGNAEMIV